MAVITELKLELIGNATYIKAAVSETYPEIDAVLRRVTDRVPFLKRQIEPWQAAVLYALARPLNRPGTEILEIGTAWGYSAAVLAEAAPEARIITLNPKQDERERARNHLRHYSNVKVKSELSWDYLDGYRGPFLDLVFIDGDHKRVGRDLFWWLWLNPGGLMLFHDYAPAGTRRPCPPVYEVVNDLAIGLDRLPDVLVIDDDKVGLAGFYRQAEEQLPSVSVNDWNVENGRWKRF